MNIEDQKFMALEGIHTWARGVLVQRKRCEECIVMMRADDKNWPEPMRVFVRERHIFLTASKKLFEHIAWAEELAFIDPVLFMEVNKFKDIVKSLRDMNEHNIEYFKGGGRKRLDWMPGTADASSTVGSKIGGRLDWDEISRAVEKLIEDLPANYFPKNNYPREYLEWLSKNKRDST